MLLFSSSAYAEGAYQRPAFEDFRLELDFSPAEAPGYTGLTTHLGLVYREQRREAFGVLGGAFRVNLAKTLELHAGFHLDGSLDDDIVPSFGFALGHSFEQIDFGARLRMRQGEDVEAGRANLNAFVVWRMDEQVAFDLSSGFLVLQVDQGPDADTRGDIYVFPRLLIQFAESFGASFGAQLAVAGKSGLDGRLQADAVYTSTAGEFEFDFSILFAYESREYSDATIVGCGAAVVY